LEEFGRKGAGGYAHHCRAVVQLIKDCLRQDELPSVNVFPPKTNLKLRTPDAKGTNRPPHSIGDFQIAEALVNKVGD